VETPLPDRERRSGAYTYSFRPRPRHDESHRPRAAFFRTRHYASSLGKLGLFSGGAAAVSAVGEPRGTWCVSGYVPGLPSPSHDVGGETNRTRSSRVSLAREDSRTWPQATGEAHILLALVGGGCVRGASCARSGPSLVAWARGSESCAFDERPMAGTSRACCCGLGWAS
jgi:hypothetical protein